MPQFTFIFDQLPCGRLFPSSKLSAPKIIDFPDPVSPVITEKPFLKSIDKKSIKIKFSLLNG